MLVRTILKAKGSSVATIRSSQLLSEAAAMLRDHRLGALVVSTDDTHIDGIISERDVVRAVANHGAGALGRTVAATMTTDVLTCVESDPVNDLMLTMTSRRIRHIPVVDAGGLLCGIISIGDVVKSHIEHIEGENRLLNDYINAR